MRRAVWCTVVIILLTSLFAGIGIARASASDVSLQLTQQPAFFDVRSPTLLLTCVPVSLRSTVASVVRVEAKLAGSISKLEGSWAVVSAAGHFDTRAELEQAWHAFSKPGVKAADESAFSDRLTRVLAGSALSAIALELPRPDGARPGDVFLADIVATLDNGNQVKTSAVVVATAWTTPNDWIIGDCHIHSSVGGIGHAGKSKSEIRSMAVARGHHFTYLTDHLDLIVADIGWGGHWSGCQSLCTTTYTMAPGCEISALGGSGDALAYGLPATLPDLVNLRDPCALLVSRIQGPAGSGRTAAVAHPAGFTPWTDHGCGYNGCQVINDEFAFDAVPYWRHDMASHISSCRASAIGGSDYHWWYTSSFGEATWVYVPSWQLASVWPGKKDAIAGAINLGRTAATDEGSLGFFIIDGKYPGDAFSRPSGSTVYYDIRAHAIDNGYNVQFTWEFYRGSTRINNGISGILPSGAAFSVNGLATTVQSGAFGYSLSVRFDYLLSGQIQWTDVSYCGPTTGRNP
ncbi:MAG: hypothetical protein Q8P50_14330 [Bacillota bacterium]|nr:hypothetical protein [Bacillota bacterium]